MKKSIQYLIFILLFCIFPARVLIHWVPILGYPRVATGIALIQYICIALLMVHAMKRKSVITAKGRKYKLLCALYWIYNVYLFYYIIINPQIPQEMIVQAFDSFPRMIQSVIETSLVIAIVTTFQYYLNVKLFAKVAAAFMVIVGGIYVLTVDISMYLYQKTLLGAEFDNFNIVEYGLIDGQTMGDFISMAFLFNFYVRNNWSVNRLINQVIFWSISVMLILFLFILGQRGPILWMGVTLLFYYFSCGQLRKIIIVTTISIIGIVILFGGTISGLMEKYDITLIERFMNISEDGGSGRFGSSDSVYSLAYKQIMESPLFGSYFRITKGRFMGAYPHNFILEFLMTFGVIFTIPLLWILWYAVKNTYYACRYSEPLAIFCIIFINVYLCHLTSFTVVNSTNMWVLLAMALCVRPNYANKTLRPKVINRKS